MLSALRKVAARFEFAPLTTSDDVVSVLVAQPHGEANMPVLEGRSQLLKRKFAASTINRHMAAIKSSTRPARADGHIAWELEIPSM